MAQVTNTVAPHDCFSAVSSEHVPHTPFRTHRSTRGETSPQNSKFQYFRLLLLLQQQQQQQQHKQQQQQQQQQQTGDVCKHRPCVRGVPVCLECAVRGCVGGRGSWRAASRSTSWLQTLGPPTPRTAALQHCSMFHTRRVSAADIGPPAKHKGE